MLRMSSQPQRFQASQQRKPCIYFSRTSLAPSPDSPPPLGQNHFPSQQHHHHHPQHARAHSHQDYNSRLPPHPPRDLWSFLTREHSPPSCARSTTFSPGIRLNFVLFTFLHLIPVHVWVDNWRKWKMETGASRDALERFWECIPPQPGSSGLHWRQAVERHHTWMHTCHHSCARWAPSWSCDCYSAHDDDCK